MKLDKTVAKTPARGPRTTGALPRYVAIGNAKRVSDTRDACDGIPEQNRGRIQVDLDANGDAVGVRIVG
jgi:hypothetical protein